MAGADARDGAGRASATAAGVRPQRAMAIGAPCPNCGAPLAGRWCHDCGQSAEDFHRSLARLGAEAFEGMVDVDGRLWRTLPDLCLRPGRLTRRYLDGQRTPQIPPFRLFLMVIVLLFLAAGVQLHGKTNLNLSGQGGEIRTNPSTAFRVVPVGGDAANAWVRTRLLQAAKNPDAFVASMAAWAQRLAVLTLPISALLLGAMFFWRRDLYLFDHLIFSMHSLSFQGLLISIVMLGGVLSGWFSGYCWPHRRTSSSTSGAPMGSESLARCGEWQCCSPAPAWCWWWR
jgi:hypothetical protein